MRGNKEITGIFLAAIVSECQFPGCREFHHAFLCCCTVKRIRIIDEIIDEPVSGLDPIQINEIRNLILSLKKDKTIILSTHLMQEIDALCDKIIILNKGKILAQGTEEEICKLHSCKNIEQAFLKLVKVEGVQNVQ